mgnify:CR=1 FL=1
MIITTCIIISIITSSAGVVGAVAPSWTLRGCRKGLTVRRSLIELSDEGINFRSVSLSQLLGVLRPEVLVVQPGSQGR